MPTQASASARVSKSDLVRMKSLWTPAPVYPPERVAQIRIQRARMSQAVFAAFLNVSVSTVQKWESACANKHPHGAAARLLQLLESKGVRALVP